MDDSMKEQYGLTEEAAYRITLKAGSTIQKQVIMETQGLGPGGDFLCIRDREEAIVSIQRSHLERISFKLNSYRSRVLLEPKREAFKTFRVWHDDELKLELKRMEEERFIQITYPFKAMADNVSDGNETPIYTYFTKIDGIRIVDFVSDEVNDLAGYGLDRPRVKAEFIWKEGGTVRTALLLFGKDAGDGKVYAAKKVKHAISSVFTVKEKDLEPLVRAPILLRDRRIFPQDVENILSAAFERQGAAWTIERSREGYFREDPESRFQQFLHTMARTQVVRYLAEPHDLKDPRFRTLEGAVLLTLRDGEEEKTVKAEIGAREEEGWYGRISTRPEGIFLLDRAFMLEFRKLFQNLPR
jgi:hypothetical protein